MVDDQNFKSSGDIKKKEDQISRRKYFFSPFFQSKVMSHLVPVILVFPDTTLKERCLG